MGADRGVDTLDGWVGDFAHSEEREKASTRSGEVGRREREEEKARRPEEETSFFGGEKLPDRANRLAYRWLDLLCWSSADPPRVHDFYWLLIY